MVEAVVVICVCDRTGNPEFTTLSVNRFSDRKVHPADRSALWLASPPEQG